jgi:hypothetical protein
MRHLAALLFTLLAGTQVTTTRVVGLPAYARAIHTLRLRLDVQASRSLPDAGTVRHIKRELRGLRLVRLSNAGLVATDTATIAGTIDPGSVSTVRAGALQLDALDAALRAGSTGASQQAVAAALAAAYAAPAFHPHCSGAGCVTQWINDHINNSAQRLIVWILSHLPGTAGLPTAVTVLSLVVVAAAVVGVVVLQRRGALRAVTAVRRPVGGMDAEPEVEDPERLALEAARLGDLRSAYRFLFLSTMLELQEQGLLRLRPGWTNRDYLATLDASAPGLRDGMRTMVDLFDRTWYGHQEPDRATFDEMLEVSRRLRHDSRRGAA